ncbi:MAG: pyridoxal-phosphate dependent enzyme [Acidobacteria bacterium]|jgi:cystathionine beta-synthase|nr:pyridoxal-phosphate dependent enzyme [Acidobacteriota bacterium]
MKRHPAPSDSILDAVGSTPLIRLQRIARGLRTPVMGKAENLNPGGSVKDRIGLAIIEGAERRGELKPGGVVVEATSGNTGVGLAVAAAIKGYRCIFTIPDKMSSEKIRLLRAFGAEVVVVPTAVPPDHPDYYLQKAKSIARSTPGSIFANQHYNPDNPEAHYRTTGPEIWEQTDGKVTHFVCAPGTGGTITGVGRYLKEQNPAVRVIAGDPVGSLYAEYARTRKMGQGGPYKVEGIGGDKIPTSLDFDVVDEWMTASDADAFRTARRLTRDEGLFIGGSGGLNVWCALEVARRVDDPEALVVTILCDTGERYLSKLYDDTWMRENQMLDAERTTAGELLERHPEEVPPIVSVGPSANLRQALNLLSTWGLSQVPVVDGDDCVGSVSEALMARVLEDGKLLDRPVSELMSGPFPVVDADVPLDRLVSLLSKETPAALIREGGRLVGIVNRYDVLREVAGIG